MKHYSKVILVSISLFIVSTSNAQKIGDTLSLADIKPLENSIDYLSRLSPVIYSYNNTLRKHTDLPAGNQIGFIPANVKKVLPGIVIEKKINFTSGKNASRMLSVETVDLDKLIPFLVAAINEQHLNIEQLKQQVLQLSKQPTTN